MPLKELSPVLSAFEAGNHSVTVSDARAPDMPLIYVSPGFMAFSGYSRDEVIGRNCRFLQGDLTDQPGLGILREAIKTRSECIVDLINFRRDGKRLYNRLSLMPIFDAAGQLALYLGLQSDVTLLMEARERLMAHFATKGLRGR